MSEITRKRFEKKVTLKHGTLTIKGRPWTTPRELGKEADFERQAEEARRKEQQIKAELDKEQKKVIEFIKGELEICIDGEFRDSNRYDFLARRMESLGWTSEAKVLHGIANDERRHKSELERIRDYPILKYLKV